MQFSTILQSLPSLTTLSFTWPWCKEGDITELRESGPEDPELSGVTVDSNDHMMILERVNNTPSMQYQDLQQEPGSSKTSARLEMVKVEDPEGETDETRLTKPLVVYIDGPFGAPTSQIFRAQHAVLIGTGIGVTPFASILQSIMHRYWQARNTCPKCQYKWTNDLSASVGLNLRKVTLKLFLSTLRLLQVFISGRLLLDQSRSKVL